MRQYAINEPKLDVEMRKVNALDIELNPTALITYKMLL